MTQEPTNTASSAATSRRGFLESLSRLAGSAAFALAGLAAGTALGGPTYSGTLCCWYCYCLDRDCERTTCINLCTNKGRCPQRFSGHRLSYAIPVASCGYCY